MKQGLIIFISVLLALLTAGIIFNEFQSRKQARLLALADQIFHCRKRLRGITTDLKHYKDRHKYDLPKSLNDIDDPSYYCYGEDIFKKDPWGNNFIYIVTPNSSEGYFLYSPGPNGKDEQRKGDDISLF